MKFSFVCDAVMKAGDDIRRVNGSGYLIGRDEMPSVFFLLLWNAFFVCFLKAWYSARSCAFVLVCSFRLTMNGFLACTCTIAVDREVEGIRKASFFFWVLWFPLLRGGG